MSFYFFIVKIYILVLITVGLIVLILCIGNIQLHYFWSVFLNNLTTLFGSANLVDNQTIWKSSWTCKVIFQLYPIKNVEYDRIRNWVEIESKWFEMVRFLSQVRNRFDSDSILIRNWLENNRREKSYVIILTLIHYFLFALSSLNC